MKTLTYNVVVRNNGIEEVFYSGIKDRNIASMAATGLMSRIIMDYKYTSSPIVKVANSDNLHVGVKASNDNRWLEGSAMNRTLDCWKNKLETLK